MLLAKELNKIVSMEAGVKLPTIDSNLVLDYNTHIERRDRLNTSLETLLSKDMSVDAEDVFKNISDIKSKVPSMEGISFESNDMIIELQIQIDNENRTIASIESNIQHSLNTLKRNAKDNLGALRLVTEKGIDGIEASETVAEYLSDALPSLIAFNGVRDVSGAIESMLSVDLKSQMSDINRLYTSVNVSDDDLNAEEIATVVSTTVLNSISAKRIIMTPLDKKIITGKAIDLSIIEDLMSTTVTVLPVRESIYSVAFGKPEISIADVLDKPFSGMKVIPLRLTKFTDITEKDISARDLSKLSKHVVKTLNYVMDIDMKDLFTSVDLEMPTYRRKALNELNAMAFASLAEHMVVMSVAITLLSTANIRVADVNTPVEDVVKTPKVAGSLPLF